MNPSAPGSPQIGQLTSVRGLECRITEIHPCGTIDVESTTTHHAYRVSGLSFAPSYPPLTAYRIHLADGTSYVTDMAAGVTLEDAKAYFLNQDLTQPDETTLRCVAVEAVNP